TDPLRGKPVRQLRPRIASIGGLEDPATRSVGRRVGVPGWTTGIPQSGVDDVRVRRVDDDFDGAHISILEQHLLPRATTVARTEHAALLVRGIEMPDGGDEHHRRVARIDGDLSDVLRVLEADVCPRRARIGGLVHPIPEACRVAQRRFAAADVDGIWCRWSDRYRADRCNRLTVEDRTPYASGVDRLPHAA